MVRSIDSSTIGPIYGPQKNPKPKTSLPKSNVAQKISAIENVSKGSLKDRKIEGPKKVRFAEDVHRTASKTLLHKSVIIIKPYADN